MDQLYLLGWDFFLLGSKSLIVRRKKMTARALK